jgi:hypothetical protein
MPEHTPDRTTIVHTQLGSGKLAPGTENYRAFKFEWHARPYEEPVLVAFKEKDGTALYVEPFGSVKERALRRVSGLMDVSLRLLRKHMVLVVGCLSLRRLSSWGV